MLPPTKSVGIITAKAPFTPDLLEAAGILPDCRRVSIVGLEKSPSFASVILNATANMDVDAVEAETVRAALDLQAKRPDIGVFLLECSELPPYAAAVQRATGVPVFDYTSMVEFFVRGVVPRRFYGIT